MVDMPTISPLVGNEPVAPELRERIAAAREKLGDRVIILGHHYQRDDVIDFADRRGDSLDLSLYAATLEDVEYVIFAGVHFMAETADIVTPENVTVLLPDLRAGCSMADMADIDQVEEAWEVLEEATDETIVPITYINSTAALKAFVGRHGGSVCTSSNAKKVVQWAFERGQKLFFFPDQHLGRNTAAELGIALDDMLVYDPHQEDGGNELEEYARVPVILWKGHCSVHQNFQPNHPDLMRQRYPGIKIIVHPECRHEVVKKADFVGSTKFIVQHVENGKPGDKWAVGTEHHLVNRLKNENPEQFVTTLAPFACQCSTMFRISPEALADSLESILDGNPRHVIRVDADTAKWSMEALNRMMEMR
jgi:quinolinate synthase